MLLNSRAERQNKHIHKNERQKNASVYYLDSSHSISAVTPTSLQTALAAQAHPIEEQTLNIEKSRIYRAESQRPTVSFSKGE
jgi:hypothetical protein